MIVKAAKCEVEIQEQTAADAGCKYMVTLSYEPLDTTEKLVFAVVLTDTLPYLKQTIDKGSQVITKKIYPDEVINDGSQNN